MKKFILFSFSIIVFLFNAQAQLETNLGLRIGGNNELSYQIGFSYGERIDLNAGLGFDKQKDSAFTTSFSLSSHYLYAYNFTGAWFVYGGLGAGLEVLDISSLKAQINQFSNIVEGKVLLLVGIEHQFDSPISLFFDYRPELIVRFQNKALFQWYGASIGLRFRFE